PRSATARDRVAADDPDQAPGDARRRSRRTAPHSRHDHRWAGMSSTMSVPRFRAGDALPAVLVLRDLAELLGLGASRTWELYQRGEFARFELLPRLGNRPRF